MARFDIFLVDADNTLLDFHASSVLSLREAFRKSGIPWQSEYAASFTALNDSLWRSLEKKEITREKLLEDRFSIFLSQIGYPNVNANEFNENFLSALAVTPVYTDGAREFLRALRSVGRVYVVTNGTTKIQRSRFALCGLNDLVDGVFVSETIGCDKPGKAYTEYVAAHIPNFEKSRAVWIGDSLSADIKAANDAGIRNFFFNPSEKEIVGDDIPDYAVKSFEEILRILQISGNKK